MRYLVLCDKYPNKNIDSIGILRDVDTFERAKEIIISHILLQHSRELKNGNYDNFNTIKVQNLRDKSEEVLQEIRHINHREWIQGTEVYTFNFVTIFYHIVVYSKRTTAVAG